MKRAFQWLCLLLVVVFLGSYYRHLTADFPAASPWSDWSKFTDEGWYSNAAIEHYLRGQWFQPGDFNAGVALPIWPAMVAVVFHFTSVTLSAARALEISCFALSLVALYSFLRRYLGGWSSALVLLLLAATPFLYSFARLAILESPVTLWLALLLWCAAASRLGGRAGWLIAGCLAALMVFTKTNAAFLLPVPVYVVWARTQCRRWTFVRAVGLAAVPAILLSSVYLAAVALTHHWQDFRYLFIANERPPLTLHSRVDAFYGAVADGRFVSPVLYLAALAVLVLAFTAMARLRRNPLLGTCTVWLACGIFFIGWHANMQPRYYFTLAPAMAILVAMALEYAVTMRRRVLFAALALVCAAHVALGLITIGRWQQHPQYTYVNAANNLAAALRAGHGRNQILMSISGSQLTLMTHLETICDDYGTDEIEDRLTRYNPGWYASWDDVDTGTLSSLHENYSLHWVGGWPAMDEPLRKVLNLYRLDPLKEDEPWQPAMDELEP